MRILMIRVRRPTNILSRNAAALINANLFSEMGDEVFLATLDGPESLDGKFSHIKMGQSSGVRPESDIIDFLLTRPSFFIDILKNVRKIAPDVIICKGGGYLFFDFLTVIFLSKLIDVPVVGEWMGSDLLLKSYSMRTWVKKLLLSGFSINFVQSEQMFKEAMKLNPESNIEILPDKGVDTEFFKPQYENIDQSETVRILYLGRLHEVKGLEYLIKAFSSVKDKHPNSILTIVGEGEEKERLMKMIRSSRLEDSVEFIGRVEYKETREYYQNSDIFVLPSLSEGLPNVLMEAMACGLPSVVTHVGGNKELIKDSKGGFLVNPKSSSELSKAINELIEDPELRNDMGEFNRKRVKKYDTKRVMRKKRMTIEKLIGR